MQPSFTITNTKSNLNLKVCLCVSAHLLNIPTSRSPYLSFTLHLPNLTFIVCLLPLSRPISPSPLPFSFHTSSSTYHSINIPLPHCTSPLTNLSLTFLLLPYCYPLLPHHTSPPLHYISFAPWPKSPSPPSPYHTVT